MISDRGTLLPVSLYLLGGGPSWFDVYTDLSTDCDCLFLFERGKSWLVRGLGWVGLVWFGRVVHGFVVLPSPARPVQFVYLPALLQVPLQPTGTHLTVRSPSTECAPTDRLRGPAALGKVGKVEGK